MVLNHPPAPNQKWAHSVCSHVKLRQVLDDPDITSIETDILMGTHERLISEITAAADKVESCPPVTKSNDTSGTGVCRRENVAIMSHPPRRASCLSPDEFFDLVIHTPRCIHMKLDFKDIEAVKPTLESLAKHSQSLSLNNGCIYLNADVLPGPGRSRAGMDPDEFLQICQDVLCANQELKNVSFYSLGWSLDRRSYENYNDDHVDEMVTLIQRYELEDSGIILALNARVLVENCSPFDRFLSEFSSSQLLVWTGSREPPISQNKIDAIKKHFELKGTSDRIGFDCLVAASSMSGIWYDSLENVKSVYTNTKRLFHSP